jgi:hypothetical protein
MAITVLPRLHVETIVDTWEYSQCIDWFQSVFFAEDFVVQGTTFGWGEKGGCPEFPLGFLP